MNPRLALLIGGLALASAAPGFALAGDADAIPRPVPPASARFAADDAAEVPDFQRHVLPLMGRVGCNTRSCHGSFQGQGGFRLSLFGYDFQADRDTLLKDGTRRVTLDDPEASKILAKPTLGMPHKGGKRLDEGTWQYRVLLRWIEGGAKGVERPSHFERLEVTPGEITFKGPGEKVPLKVVAHWADGGTEDVTCLARFRTNDESIAEVGEDGVVTSTGAGDTHVVAFYDNGVATVPVLRPVSALANENYPPTPTTTKIDELVVAKLRKLGIIPSPPCTDAEFLRRVGIDLTGTLPTPSEVEEFLSDPGLDKRARKVEELLARPSYAAWWTTKLCDFTGDGPKVLNIQQVGAQAPRQWYEWLHKRVLANEPYDQIVAGFVLATSRPKGQDYMAYVKEMAAYAKPDAPDAPKFADRATMPWFWARQNFRKPEEKVIGFSYAFLGVRLECAQCHKHPFDQWTQDDFRRFGAFFDKVNFGIAPESRADAKKLNEDTGLDKLQGGERNRKIQQMRAAGEVTPWQEVFVARAGGPQGKIANAKKLGPMAAGRVVSAKVLGGDEVSIAGVEDARSPLMDWLRSKDNPYFARAFVNRAWASYFGSGLVHPTDDMNLANPPSNAPLFDYLAEGLVDHGFDMKWLHREIILSAAYQRGWQVNETNRLDERNQSRAVIRRLPAEVLIDAVAQATAGSKTLATASTDMAPRAIGPRAGSGQGRLGNNYAAKVFGSSTRETNCDCNRSDEPNLLQAIYLQNDADLDTALNRPDGWLAEWTGTQAKPGEPPIPAPDLEGTPMAELERRLKQARELNQAARIARLEGRIAYVKGRGHAPPSKPDKPLAMTPADRDGFVREAYLRTLGRHPSEPEAGVATGHLLAAEDGPRALRELLWALLNTKEFATNH